MQFLKTCEELFLPKIIEMFKNLQGKAKATIKSIPLSANVGHA